VRLCGFVLLPGFGLQALAGATEVLQAMAAVAALPAAAGVAGLPAPAGFAGLPAAGGVAGLPAYAVQLLSPRGGLVTAQGGMALATQSLASAAATARTLDAVFVVSDGDARLDPEARALLLDALQRHAAAGASLGGLGCGALWLAEAGLLRGHRATVHWPQLPAFAEAHADTVVSRHCYEIDRGRLSAAGHGCSTDLLIAWLGQRHGERIAQELLLALGLERLRARDERQREPGSARAGGGSTKLGEAVALMEANLGEPLPTEDVARLVGVSRRQLERLFKQHLDALPSRWYLGLRLARARRLLQQTSQSILQIGLSCGFASGSHFSNAYRAHFGHTPRDERSQRAAAWRIEAGPAPAPLPPAPAPAAGAAAASASEENSR
jgi:transcriptional regulator GlxA family with amidase domain